MHDIGLHTFYCPETVSPLMVQAFISIISPYGFSNGDARNNHERMKNSGLLKTDADNGIT